jgi:hypothetical protein
MPKLKKSASESSSAPISLTLSRARAILPSAASRIAARTISSMA